MPDRADKHAHIQALIGSGNETWLKHEDEPHAFASNMWWRLANFTAKSTGKQGDCYVCTKMPQSASGPHVTVQSPTTEEELFCPLYLSNIGALAPQNSTGNWTCPGNRVLTVAVQVHVKVATVGPIPDSLFCMERKIGAATLGSIPENKCNQIYRRCEVRNMPCCLSCLTGKGTFDVEECSKRSSLPLTTLHAYAGATPEEQELCDEYCGLYSGKNCNRYVPSVKGTRALKDWFWLCGHMVYTSLPFNWSGRCALVTLEEYSMVIRQQRNDRVNNQRNTRALSDRSSVSSLGRDNPVPKEHRLWTGTEKFFEGIFPMIGVTSLQIEVEVTRYELISFIKTTRNTLAGVKEELRALRLTALQNRLVLDQLTASRGGVCVIVGISCCTYIPDNDADGHIIADGIDNMTRIADELQRREVSDRSGFLDWFTNWKQMLISALIPIGVILLILTFIVCCIIPFIRMLIHRAMNTFVSSQYALMNRTVKY
ncbi:uncharacterized protein LOC143740322 [Siphateles boraxobius]|uniref:uncharacterized protein LOC143740322 n=1 Tax=Siphateles boraxobius TaxID=180520 RepID=UPI00406308A4